MNLTYIEHNVESSLIHDVAQSELAFQQMGKDIK